MPAPYGSLPVTAQAVRWRSILSHAGPVWSAALVPAPYAVLVGAVAAGAAAGLDPAAATPALAPPPGRRPGGGEAAGAVLCTAGGDGTVRGRGLAWLAARPAFA
jgi:hypothetical protein